MAKTVECEIFLVVDEDGNHSVSVDNEDCVTNHTDNHGGLACRVIKLTLTVPVPEMIEVSATIPENAEGEIKLSVG